LEVTENLRYGYLNAIYSQQISNFISSLPYQLPYFEENLKGNYFGGFYISIADASLFCLLDAIKVLSPNFMDNFPILSAWFNKINQHPRVSHYLYNLNKRPFKVNEVNNSPQVL